MKKTLSIILLLSFAVMASFAQDSIKVEKKDVKMKFKILQLDRVSLALGTNGISTEVSHQIGESGLINLQASYLFYQSDFIQGWGLFKVTTKPNINSPILGLSYDWFPLQKSGIKWLNAVKLKGAVQYAFNPIYKFNSTLADDVTWGKTTFTKEQIGSIETTIRGQKIQPYLAAGFDQFFKSNKIGFGLDLGAMYQGNPKVTMIATNMLVTTASQANIIENNIKGYRFIPYAAIKLNLHL